MIERISTGDSVVRGLAGAYMMRSGDDPEFFFKMMVERFYVDPHFKKDPIVSIVRSGALEATEHIKSVHSKKIQPSDEYIMMVLEEQSFRAKYDKSTGFQRSVYDLGLALSAHGRVVLGEDQCLIFYDLAMRSLVGFYSEYDYSTKRGAGFFMDKSVYDELNDYDPLIKIMFEALPGVIYLFD